MSYVEHKIFSDKNNKRIFSAMNNSLIDIDKLTNDVISTIVNINKELRQEFPKSVYQLKLLNSLTKKGFKLEAETSMLNHCVKNEPDRELIIVNGLLVIECIKDDEVTSYSYKRILFDLQNNGHAIGLLINFNLNTRDEGITKVYQNFGIH